MSAFVDPRSHPLPSGTKPPARTTADPEALAELHRFCRAGRLYDVERWIQGGRPLQIAQGARAKGRHVASALEIALESRNHALVLLLLCNGYDQSIEASCSLDLALRARRWDLVDMLLEWGADPHRVNLWDLFDTYRTELFERFRALGVDLTAGHVLAEALAYHTSNKPLFGFARRHREHDPAIQRELNMALSEHAREGNEKGVLLCLWGGADPHAPSRNLRDRNRDDDDSDQEDEEDRFLGFTAIHEACSSGEVEILERLGPDPSRDDFDDLFRTADNSRVVDVLARQALPKDVGQIVRFHVVLLESWPYVRQRSVDTLTRIFEVGARWQTTSPDEIASVRRSLLKMSDHVFVDVVKLFATEEHVSPVILQALGRTPKIRERMKKVGLIPLPPEDPHRYSQSRPTRSREVLLKFGIEVPKQRESQKPSGVSKAEEAPPRLPRPVNIGLADYYGTELRLDRATLFERVWSEPVEKLAKGWGLSGRGLAKACERLHIPVPPRGYWAKVQHGFKVRRPRLPELPAGEVEEIVIRLPAREVGEQAPSPDEQPV